MNEKELAADGWVEYEGYYVAGMLCKCGRTMPATYPWPNRHIPAYNMIPDVCPSCGTLKKNFTEVALFRKNWKKKNPWYMFWAPEEKTATFKVKGGSA